MFASTKKVQISASDKIKAIISTEAPAAQKKKRKRENSRCKKIAMHRQ